MDFKIEDYSNEPLMSRGKPNDNHALIKSMINTADKLQVSQGFFIPLKEFKGDVKILSLSSSLRKALNTLQTKYKSNGIDVSYALAQSKDASGVCLGFKVKRIV